MIQLGTGEAALYVSDSVLASGVPTKATVRFQVPEAVTNLALIKVVFDREGQNVLEQNMGHVLDLLKAYTLDSTIGYSSSNI